MSFDLAIRLTEILLAWAFIQQSAEHIRGSKVDRIIFIPRLILSVVLMVGVQTQWVCLLLCVVGLFILKRFQGPYNGGSDRMSHLILWCVSLSYFMPTQEWKEYIFGYLAVQLILSYLIAGWVKIINPEWRNGRALQDVFQFSTYPVSENLRGLAHWPRLLFFMSWAVMIFELCFPFSLLTQTTLMIGLCVATLFHLANACLFGFNRFFWIWLAAYPSIIWLQDRLF
ncbi:MAG: HTTM domain-containing protein [Kordiimonadaceae bacterium]|nr:HTTM domain-containing protein [Kordiimonadaceae bacterium]